MAIKLLDLIEKQNRRSNLKFVSDRQMDIQAGRRLDSAPSANVVAVATRVGRTRFCMVALNRHSRKSPRRPKHMRPIRRTSGVIGDFSPNFVAMATRVGPTTFCTVPFNRP